MNVASNPEDAGGLLVGKLADVSLQPAILRINTIFLHVTKACNLSCFYCYFSASRSLPNEMTTNEFQALWPQIVHLRPSKVIFTGGEPLLRSDICDLMAGLKKTDADHHVLRCLNTNGHYVNGDFAGRLVGLADEVRVSLDGLRERNDVLRGCGNFDASLRAIESFKAVGFEPKILVTVTSATLPDLEALISMLIEIGIKRINLNGFRAIGRGR